MVRNFLTEPVFGDPELETLFSSPALARAHADVEAALARAQAGLGIIPDEAATAITLAAERLEFPPGALAQGVADTGIPVPALVKLMRAEVGEPHADWVHWGATSQDIIDNAMTLCSRAALRILSDRLSQLIGALSDQSAKHADTVMAARTRGQLATPTTFGLRIAQWAQPLIGSESEIEAVSKHAFRVQFGGASGNQSAIAPHGPDVAERLAAQLDLPPSPPWHTDRTGFRALSNWLVDVTIALGKIATDLILLSRGEVAEAFGGLGGGSSTMPHKSNPVTAEAVVALSRMAVIYGSGLTETGIHSEERDGPHWTLEWKLLPDLFICCGRALSQSQVLIQTLSVNKTTMSQRIESAPEIMAEAAVFALAERLGRQKATQVVAQALSQPDPLPMALGAVAPDVDWAQVLDPNKVIEASQRVADSVFARRRSSDTGHKS